MSATRSKFAGAQQGNVATGFDSLFRMQSGGNARASARTHAAPFQRESGSRIPSGVGGGTRIVSGDGEKRSDREGGEGSGAKEAGRGKGRTGDGTDGGGEAVVERPEKMQAAGAVLLSALPPFLRPLQPPRCFSSLRTAPHAEDHFSHLPD